MGKMGMHSIFVQNFIFGLHQSHEPQQLARKSRKLHIVLKKSDLESPIVNPTPTTLGICCRAKVAPDLASKVRHLYGDNKPY